MSKYTVELAPTARRELRKLDAVIRQRILQALAALADDPRPNGCKKMVGEDDVWRIRIGDYRAIYEIIDEQVVVTVVRVRHRREAYRP